MSSLEYPTNSIFRPLDRSYVEAVWSAKRNLILDRCGVDLDEAIRRAWDRNLGLPGWALDSVTGTHPSKTKQFAQAGDSAKEPITIEEICANMILLHETIGGDLDLELHTGLYYDSPTDVDWDKLEYCHFSRLVEQMKSIGGGVTICPTMFDHDMVKNGSFLSTLSSNAADVREFWLIYNKRNLDIAQKAADELGRKVHCGLWMIDGHANDPIDALTPRQLMRDGIGELAVYCQSTCPDVEMSVEFKLTAGETPGYVTGSQSLLQGVAQEYGIRLLIDTGHGYLGQRWHDLVADMVALDIPLALHVSRGIHGDNDLTVQYCTELQYLFTAIKRCGVAESTLVAIDTFDKTVDPRQSLWLSAMAVRAAQVIAEIDPYAALKTVDEEPYDCQGAKLYGQLNLELPSPALIFARAAYLGLIKNPDILAASKKFVESH